jgi:hypothetical protein
MVPAAAGIPPGCRPTDQRAPDGPSRPGADRSAALRRREPPSSSCLRSLFSSLVKSRVPEDMRGRAFTGLDMLCEPVGSCVCSAEGVLADAWGTRCSTCWADSCWLPQSNLRPLGPVARAPLRRTSQRHRRQVLVGFRGPCPEPDTPVRTRRAAGGAPPEPGPRTSGNATPGPDVRRITTTVDKSTHNLLWRSHNNQ